MASEPRLPSTKRSFTREPAISKFPNATKNNVLGIILFIEQGIILFIEQGKKLVSKRQQVCLTMRHDYFDNGQILRAVAWFCKVTKEGPIESLFDIIQTNDVENDENAAVGVMTM